MLDGCAKDAGVLPDFMALAPQQASVLVQEFCKHLSLMSGLRRLSIPCLSWCCGVRA